MNQVIPLHKPTPQHSQSGRSVSVNDRVMVISTQESTRHRLQCLLGAAGYRALFEDDLQQALDVIQRTHIQLIIIDSETSRTSCLELCKGLHNDAQYQRPHIMLLTEKTVGPGILTAIHAGVDDFLFAPLSSEELHARLLAGIRMLRLRDQNEHRSLQLADALNREADAKKTIRKGMRAVAKTQRDLLTDDDSPFTSIEIESLFLPAGIVANDSFSYFKLDEDHLGFYMIDATGNELASALLSVTVSRTLTQLDTGVVLRRSTHNDGLDADWRMLPAHITLPGKVVCALNTRFVNEDTGVDYFTMVYGVINVHTGTGEICQAGHPHPIIITGESQIVPFGNGGFTVGLVEDASYDTIGFQLEPGDRLFLYSDGLTDDNPLAHDGCFGIQRLGSLLQTIHGKPLSEGFGHLTGQLDDWQKNKPLDNDISLLAIGLRKEACSK